MSRLKKVRSIGLAILAAVVLAFVSASFLQVGPELVQYGDSDYRPVLKGGFPVAYLFDAPGISIERQLSFIEDKLSLGALILDITIYFGLVLLASLALARRR